MSDESVTLRHEGKARLEKLSRENKAREIHEREKYAKFLATALDTLKAKGVKTFNGMLGLAPFTVEFFPPPGASALEKMPAATGEEKCECGCSLSDHEAQGGTCLHGCPAEKCGVNEEQP